MSFPLATLSQRVFPSLPMPAAPVLLLRPCPSHRHPACARFPPQQATQNASASFTASSPGGCRATSSAPRASTSPPPWTRFGTCRWAFGARSFGAGYTSPPWAAALAPCSRATLFLAAALTPGSPVQRPGRAPAGPRDAAGLSQDLYALGAAGRGCADYLHLLRRAAAGRQAGTPLARSHAPFFPLPTRAAG